jgi:hypothetical protein
MKFLRWHEVDGSLLGYLHCVEVNFDLEDGNSMCLSDIGIQPEDYLVQQPRKPPSAQENYVPVIKFKYLNSLWIFLYYS